MIGLIEERDDCKRLVANAKEQESQDTSGEFIYRGKGSTWKNEN